MKKKNLIRLQDISFGTIAVSSLFLLLGANGAFATTSAVDEVTITVPASCTMSTTVNSNHTATVEVGSYVDDIGDTTFKVVCNDAEGFSVYAVGYSGDTFGNTTMKPSVLADANAIATGLATSGDTSNWAMKLTAVTGDYAPTLETGFNAYHVVPAEYTKVASYASNTDSSSGSSFKSTYAAFVASAQPADTYTGKVKYTVVHPANADTPPRVSIEDLTYMQDFNNLSAEDRVGVTLSMQYDKTYNLIDNRDNRTYQVARLKDDGIWMAENLDLGRTALTQDLTSANTNLDANAATVSAETFNSWVKSSSSFTDHSAELIPLSTSNTSDGRDTDLASNTPYGTLYNYCATSAGTICTTYYYDNATSDICPAGWRLPTGNTTGEFQALYDLTDYKSIDKMRAPITSGGAAFALAGYFYTSTPIYQGSIGEYWSSTLLNSTNMCGVYFSASSDNIAYTLSSRSNGKALRCIAKKPHSLTISYDVGVSSVQVDGVTILNGETIEVEGGFTYSITMTPDAGYYAYWSATSGVIDYADNWTTTFVMGNSDGTLTANASYVTTEMQNLSSSNCTTTASHVRDNRDDHVYTIQRLADGKCWMIDNLDLGRTELTVDLTSSNTNLTDTVTASTFNGWKKTSGSASYTSGEFIPINGYDPTSKTPYSTLYNYCVTSAGTICADEDSNTENATSDICPAGWRLPAGGYYGEFRALYNLPDYNTYAKMRAPITSGGAAFASAGYFRDSIPQQTRFYGDYWSSTRSNGSCMYILDLNSGVYPNASGYRRYLGHSVRCISDI